MLLGAGAIYVTVNEGVWSTSESGLCAAQRLRTYVLPETTQYWDKVNSHLIYDSTMTVYDYVLLNDYKLTFTRNCSVCLLWQIIYSVEFLLKIQ